MENQTKIFVRDLELDALIGIYDEEIGRKQPIRVNIEAILNFPEVASDNIESTISYAPFVKEVHRLANIQTGLAEALALKIADFCLQKEQIKSVTVKVEKLSIFPNCSVGAEITKMR